MENMVGILRNCASFVHCAVLTNIPIVLSTVFTVYKSTVYIVQCTIDNVQ